MPNPPRWPRFACTLHWLSGSVICAFALALPATARASPEVETGTHAFNAEASEAGFSVRTLWLSSVDGRFDRVSGFLRVDENGKISVFAWVDMDELRMGSERYAETLRSAEFFDVANFRNMRFRSVPFASELLRTGGNIRGWLTLRGRTRPVRFMLAAGECEDPLHDACLLSLRGSIDRSDFGMTAHGLSVSHRVRLRLEVKLVDTQAAP